jgi:hypothetical protein
MGIAVLDPSYGLAPVGHVSERVSAISPNMTQMGNRLTQLRSPDRRFGLDYD